MTSGENLGSNNLLVIAGLLAIVAAVLYFAAPAETMAMVAERVGLHDPVVGPVPPAILAAARGEAVKPEPESAPDDGELRHSRPSGAGALSAFFHSHGPAAQRPTPGADPKAPAETPNFVHPRTGWRPVIKATTREGGHLVERYLFLNGGVVVMVDGRIVLVS